MKPDRAGCRCPCRCRRAELVWCPQSDRKWSPRPGAVRRWQRRRAGSCRPRTRARGRRRARATCIPGAGGLCTSRREWPTGRAAVTRHIARRAQLSSAREVLSLLFALNFISGRASGRPDVQRLFRRRKCTKGHRTRSRPLCIPYFPEVTKMLFGIIMCTPLLPSTSSVMCRSAATLASW